MARIMVRQAGSDVLLCFGFEDPVEAYDFAADIVNQLREQDADMQRVDPVDLVELLRNHDKTELN